MVDVPEDPHAMRSLRDIYKEIEMLEHLAHLPCVCELYDYGVAEDTIFIVMRDYKCDLLVSVAFNVELLDAALGKLPCNMLCGCASML